MKGLKIKEYLSEAKSTNEPLCLIALKINLKLVIRYQ